MRIVDGGHQDAGQGRDGRMGGDAMRRRDWKATAADDPSSSSLFELQLQRLLRRSRNLRQRTKARAAELRQSEATEDDNASSIQRDQSLTSDTTLTAARRLDPSDASMAVLPPPSPDQVYVQVSPIPGGFITLSDHHFIHPATPGSKRTVPSLTFLIQHPGTSQYGSSPTQPFRLMFDLGLRKDLERYPAVLQKHLEGRVPFDLSPGVAAQLTSGDLSPNEIDMVILSHVHYDHHGDLEDFPQSRFRVGHGALEVLAHGLGGHASHQHFDPDTLPADRSEEFPDPGIEGSGWNPLGPFPAALDLFQDESVFVIDTPGHLPGHVNLLCRTKEKWICLCGDAFHDRRLLTGEKEIGTWEGPDGSTFCIHVDKEAAAESIRRLRVLESSGEIVEIVAAHEEIWWERNKHKQFPGTM